MTNSYIRRLKLANHLILAMPSNPTLLSSLQPTEKPFNQTCVANQLSAPAARSQEALKSNGKVRKKWIKVNNSCKNIQKPPEG